MKKTIGVLLATLAASGATVALVATPGHADTTAPIVHAVPPAGTTPTAREAAVLQREDQEVAAGTPAPMSAFSPAAATGNRTLCRDASVREADKAHVVGYAYKGNVMNVDHYADHVNPAGAHSTWAYGVVSAPAGRLTGYVLYDSGTFC